MPLLERLHSLDDVQIEWDIAATPEAVWQHVVSPGALGQWLGQPRVMEPRVGGQIVVDHGDGYVCESRILTLDPDAHLAMTWKFPDEPQTLVSFELAAAGDQCRLLLSHRKLGELVTSYADGWPVHLSYLEAAVLGAPLPASQFWNLHATMARLSMGAMGR